MTWLVSPIWPLEDEEHPDDVVRAIAERRALTAKVHGFTQEVRIFLDEERARLEPDLGDGLGDVDLVGVGQKPSVTRPRGTLPAAGTGPR